MLRHIRDFYAQSAGKLKLYQDSTQIDNRKKDPKVANSEYVLRINGRRTFVSQSLSHGFCGRDVDEQNFLEVC